MNKRELYLKTADYLEANPNLYNFGNNIVPSCGTPGCMVGLMGMLVGDHAGENIRIFAREYLDEEYDSIIFLVDEAAKSLRNINRNNLSFIDLPYTESPIFAAKCLRHIANEMETNIELGSWDELADVWQPNKDRELTCN